MLILQQTDIRNMLESKGVRIHQFCPYFTDELYVAIRRSDLGQFGREFFQYMTAGDMYEWEKVHDCENKATEAWSFSNRKHKYAAERDEFLKTKSIGCAFAHCDYRPDSGGAHEINLFISEEKRVVEAWEPQTTQVQYLSATEWQSIYFSRW